MISNVKNAIDGVSLIFNSIVDSDAAFCFTGRKSDHAADEHKSKCKYYGKN